MRAVERGFAKGRLSDPDEAVALLQDICQRLGIEREALALTLPVTERI
jgi:proteasome assembly chaperone (PAC2) family protein